MITSHSRWLAAFGVAAAVAWVTYDSAGMLLGGAVLAVLCVAFIGLFWMGGSRRGADVLHDPAVSTLVFPPESKFQQSVLPPR
jgi:hypothetical protein